MCSKKLIDFKFYFVDKQSYNCFNCKHISKNKARCDFGLGGNLKDFKPCPSFLPKYILLKLF